MSADRRLPALESWDELTRDVRAPARRATRARHSMFPPMAALVGAIAIVGITVVPQILQGSGGAVGASTSPFDVGTTPPTVGATPDRRRLVRLWDVTLRENGTVVRVVYLGDTCAKGYEGTARMVGVALEIGVYELPADPLPTPEGTGGWPVCAGVGTQGVLELALEGPFTGNVVEDLSGQTLYLGPPDWLAAFGAVPEGWGLREDGNVLGDYPRWKRVWSPVRNPDPLRDPFLELIQSHDGPVQVDGGSDRSRVEIHGRPAELQVQPNYGMTGFRELVLIWSIDGDGFALVGLSRDFSRDELIALAESITLP